MLKFPRSRLERSRIAADAVRACFEKKEVCSRIVSQKENPYDDSLKKDNARRTRAP